ncbi:MAG: hypothetical protein ACOYLB_11750 [Phototrophicaceae bacterium]
MMSRRIPLLIVVMVISMGAVVRFALAQNRTPLPAGDRSANLQATLDARQQSAQQAAEGAWQTVTAAAGERQGQVDAAATAIPITLTAGAETRQANQANIQATATVGAETRQDTRENLQVNATQLAITRQAQVMQYQTRVAVGQEALRATADAVRTQIPATIQSLTVEQMEAYIQSIAEHAEVSIDLQNQSLTAVYTLEEALLNEQIMLALSTSGYNPSAVGVDFVVDGMFTTLEGATANGQVGRMLIFSTLSAVDGRVLVDVVYATLNDVPLPEEVVADLEAQFDGTLSQQIQALIYEELGVSYSVTDLFTTDTAAVFTMLIPFTTAQG